MPLVVSNQPINESLAPEVWPNFPDACRNDTSSSTRNYTIDVFENRGKIANCINRLQRRARCAIRERLQQSSCRLLSTGAIEPFENVAFHGAPLGDPSRDATGAIPAPSASTETEKPTP
jgi:hypothetical protein